MPLSWSVFKVLPVTSWPAFHEEARQPVATGEKSRVCEPPTSPSCARVARCAPGVPTLTDTITHRSVEASCQAQPAAAVRADLLRSGNRSSLQTLRTWAVLPKTRRRAPRLHAATTPRARAAAATPPLSSQGRSCAVLVLVSARVLGRPADCDPNRARPCHVCECAHRRAGHLGRTNVHPSSDSYSPALDPRGKKPACITSDAWDAQLPFV